MNVQGLFSIFLPLQGSLGMQRIISKLKKITNLHSSNNSKTAESSSLIQVIKCCKEYYSSWEQIAPLDEKASKVSFVSLEKNNKVETCAHFLSSDVTVWVKRTSSTRVSSNTFDAEVVIWGKSVRLFCTVMVPAKKIKIFALILKDQSLPFEAGRLPRGDGAAWSFRQRALSDAAIFAFISCNSSIESNGIALRLVIHGQRSPSCTG